MIDIAALDEEIRGGLRNQRDRLDCARANLDFLRGDFDAYGPQYPDGSDVEPPKYPRQSLFMQQVVDKLTSHLYAKGPAREFEDAGTTAWLQEQYQRAGADAIMQEADRLSLAADAAAIQAVGPDESSPTVRLHLWDASQFCVWESPDDPLKVDAVATIDMYDGRRRLRLWTADRLVTYQTDRVMPGQTAGGTAYHLVADKDNAYGVIPFAFTHARRPSTDFWAKGPGTNLRRANDYINFGLTDSGASLGFAIRPILEVNGNAGVPPKARPGAVWYNVSAAADVAGNGIPPENKYLQPDVGWVDVYWSDTQSFIDATLETLGIPKAAYRMVDTSAKSGAAIVAEQMPLVQRAIGLQRPWGDYERDLARVVLAVGGRDPSPADRMTLRWPSMLPDVPMYGSEAQAADEADLDLGIVSRIQVVMRRQSMTREQAILHLKQVAEDKVEEGALGLVPADTKAAEAATSSSSRGQPDAQGSDAAQSAADGDE